MLTRRTIYKYLGLLIAPALAVLFYMPGADGIFLFDDFPNLGGLAEVSGGVFSTDFWVYVFSASGIPGRPLSLFTFALQSGCWPENAGCFQVLNIYIHALNGVLVGILGLHLFKRVGLTSPVFWGVLLALIWVTAPVHVSTVLYSVQRMNLLSGTFVLIGLNLVMHIVAKGDRLSPPNEFGFYAFFFAYYGLIFLGVLAKENAILLSLFAVILLTFSPKSCRSEEARRTFKWYWLGLFFPFACFIVYILYDFDVRVINEYQRREFTMVERLLTEMAILLDYMRLIIFPKPDALGLFNDDYVIYGSVFGSWKIPLFLIFALASIILWVRKKWYWFSLGIVFFLGGHVIESTIIPLELYFEHRNYIPSIGIYFSLLYLLSQAFSVVNSKFIKRAISFVLVLYFSVWCGILFKEVRLWASPLLQAETWYQQHPSSLRALGHYASIVKNTLGFEKARAIAIEHYSRENDPTSLLFAQYYNCEVTLSDSLSNSMVEGFKHVEFNYGILVTIQGIINAKLDKKCTSIPYSRIKNWLAALEENPSFSPRRTYISILRHRILIAQGEFRDSVEVLLRESRLNDRLDLLVGAAQSAVLAQRYDLAQVLIDEIEVRCEGMSKSCFSNATSINGVRESLNEYRQNRAQ